MAGASLTAATGQASAPQPETLAHTGSLSRRMMGIAAAWIMALLLLGGIALDRVLLGEISRQFEEELQSSLVGLLRRASVNDFGEIELSSELADERFLNTNSHFFWQISADGAETFASRSLWDERLEIDPAADFRETEIYNLDHQEQTLRVVHQTVELPNSDKRWQFVVAASRAELDAGRSRIRSILGWSFAVLGVGLFLMAVAQTWYGLGPLRRIRVAIAEIRNSGSNRVTEPFPLEVQPMVEELNALLVHSQRQAEEARTHAGNLAHALKTPLAVLTNAAEAHAPDLPESVLREAQVMRRQVDHHLARARAVGRRSVGHARANVRTSAEAVRRAVERLYPECRVDCDGATDVEVAMERQDLDEILGNLIENAAKYGGGSVFITVDARPGERLCAIWIEDDGAGIAPDKRGALFTRGARLDTEKPGTGLGLAIVRDVAEIYGGSVSLGESEDLGGLLVELTLPRAG